MIEIVRRPLALTATVATAIYSGSEASALAHHIYWEGTLIEPSRALLALQFDCFWRMCVAALVYVAARQVLLHRARWRQLAFFITLVAVAAYDGYYHGFIPSYVALGIGLGLLVFYGGAFLRDVQAMTPTTRHWVAFLGTSFAAVYTLSEVHDLITTELEWEWSKGGMLVEPWFYTGLFWHICLAAAGCEIARQVLLRRPHWLRLAFFTPLAALAWSNQYDWAISIVAMLITGLGLLALYCEMLLRDLQTLPEIPCPARSPVSHPL